MSKQIDLLTDPRFSAARVHFVAACAMSRAHSTLAQSACAEFGEHGPLISGVVHDHFPDDIKTALRTLAHGVTAQSDKARSLRPKRIQNHTMRRLASTIATRDGSGFYGPQPFHK